MTYMQLARGLMASRLREGEVNVKLLWICCVTNPQQIEVMEFVL